MTPTGDEARYQARWGRHADTRSVGFLRHLLDTAEAYQARYSGRPVPVGPDGQPDVWVVSMREDNEREVRDLRRRLTELGAEPGDARGMG